MKLTKKMLKGMIKEIISETDGFPNLVKKNKEVRHNWATHMEWKFSTDKNKYGNVIGEVKHHTLFEDGSITTYDIQFGRQLVKSIPADRLTVVKEQGHSHAPTEDHEDEEEKDC